MKNKSIRFLALTLAAVLMSGLLTGCNGRENLYQIEPPTYEEPASQSGDTPAALNLSASQQEDIKAMNNFAFEFIDLLEPGDRTMISPTSLDIALSMLIVGAEGETKNELMNALNITDPAARTQNISDLMKRKYSSNTELNIANSVWTTPNAEYAANSKKDFFDVIKKDYSTENFSVNFASEQALEEINEWVSKKTNGMINPFLDRIDPTTEMALINAIYFKAEWKTKFDAKHTKNATFYGQAGESNVPFMNMYDQSFRYISNDNLRGIELPYGDGNTAMDIFIPSAESEKTAYEIMSSMTPEERTALIAQFNGASIEEISTLSLPKFEFETDLINCIPALKQMGVNAAFEPSVAELDKIGEDLFVSKVLQKAKIIVDENGTEAAAATAVMLDKEAATISEPLFFTIDHPFFYCIRDTQSGEILFMGYINNL